MKTLKRVIFYVLLAFASLFVGLLVSAYVFKDRIIKQFILEANKSLNTPVSIGRIDVSAWNDFPNLAIVFHDVYIEDSHPGKDTLLTAKTVSFQLDPIAVWGGDYDVRGLRVENSITRLKINSVGKSNYYIIKEGDGKNNGNIAFDLEDVKLVNTVVSYADVQSHQHHSYSSENIDASISITNAVYRILANGDVTTRQIGVGDQLFLVDKTFRATANIDYDDQKKIVTINPSALELDHSVFELTGVYSFLQKNKIDLEAHGKDTDIQTVMTLLPKDFSERFRDYQSDGEVYFTVHVQGEMSETRHPMFSIAFGCSNATVFHPKFNTRITGANLEGSFATSSFADLSRSELFLRNIKGKLNGQDFEADFSMQNFEDPFIDLVFKGELDAASILQFYPMKEISKLTGNIKADLSMKGYVALLKNRATAQKVRTQGILELRDVDITFGNRPVELKGLNGTLQFNNNDLALSNTRGKLGKSDFILNGLFKNSITFLLFENQPIGIEADLKSNYLDLDELFSIVFGERTSDQYEFAISPDLHFNFNCDLGTLHYKKFKPHNVKGNLLIKNQMAVSRKLSFDAMGGAVTLNGIVDAKNPQAIDVVSGFNLSGVHIDSLFYVFENFSQNFVQDKHLRGQAFAEITTEMILDEKLNLRSESLVADISAVIRNGELNNFEPLKQLNKYLDDEGLSKLRFADLRNDIHVENKLIIIPQMEVRSNVTTIQVSGTHTFDGRIDYRVIAPLRNRKKIDPDEAFGAIEQDGSGQSRIFLKITGTTDEYDVSYDKQALKKKIAGDLKKEVQELREAIRLKGKKKKKEIELSDDTFDWENN